MNLSSRIKIGIWILAFVVMQRITFNFHKWVGESNYHSEIWGDKAGYYVYLPATFLYHFKAASFPDSIDLKTGGGFSLDRIQNKINTKYPCGVAILELPFFLAAHLYCKHSGTEANGFTRPYQYAIDFAAICYLMAGLYFLFRFLKNYFEEKTILLSFCLFLTGTNLFYYAVMETGLSHVYSFFLFSCLLFLYKKFLAAGSWKYIFPISLCVALILLVRPVNAIFLPVYFLLDTTSIPAALSRFAREWKKWGAFFLLTGVMIIPQLVYYLYQSGKAVNYSYENESFIHKFSPKVLNVLFAFENGWLTNNPIHLFTLAGCVIMIRKKQKNAWLSLILILLITYIYGSWWSYHLGCGLGHRGFVEFYSFLLIPFTFCVQQVIGLENKNLKYPAYVLLALCIVINIKLCYTFDACWYGSGAWDYSYFHHLIFSPTSK